MAKVSESCMVNSGPVLPDHLKDVWCDTYRILPRHSSEHPRRLTPLQSNQSKPGSCLCEAYLCQDLRLFSARRPQGAEKHREPGEGLLGTFPVRQLTYYSKLKIRCESQERSVRNEARLPDSFTAIVLDSRDERPSAGVPVTRPTLDNGTGAATV